MAISSPETNSSEKLSPVEKIQSEEKKTLSDVKEFTSTEKGKSLINGETPATTAGEKNVKEKADVLRKNIEQMKNTTTFTGDVKREMIATNEIPNEFVKTINTIDIRNENYNLKNRWQTLGEANVFDPSDENIKNTKNKILEVMNDPKSDTKISIVWRSDANPFKWSEQPNSQSQKLLRDHANLMNTLQNDLPQDKKATLTMPAMPDKNNPEAMSDRLNTVLAQARALKAINGLKSLLWEKFKDFIAKADLSINAAVPNSYYGEDRWVGILFTTEKKEEGTSIIENPKKFVETKENIHNQYSIYKMITDVPNGGNNTTTRIMECKVSEVVIKQSGKPDKIKVHGDRSVVENASTKLKNNPNINDLVSTLPIRSSSSITETTTTQIGLDKDKQPKTIVSKKEETNWIPWTKIILPTESISKVKEITQDAEDNKLPKIDSWSTSELVSYFNARYPLNQDEKSQWTLTMIKKRGQNTNNVPSFN